MTLSALWLGMLAVLVAVIGWETDWGRQVRRTSTAPAPAASPVAVALLPDYASGASAGTLRETIERPVFVPTRRQAPPPPPPEAVQPQMKRGQFVLTGTAVIDQQAIAFLREAATGKARSVRKGDTINGLVVSEVTPDRVVLSQGAETEPLPLKVAAGPRVTIQPAVPVPPGAPPGVPPGAVPAGAPPGAVPAAAGAPVAGAAPGVAPTAGMSLLERRRAARAAQAAAEAAAAGGAPPPAPPAQPVPSAPPPQPGAAAAQPPGPTTTDPTWAEVYRRMRQPPGG